MFQFLRSLVPSVALAGLALGAVTLLSGCIVEPARPYRGGYYERERRPIVVEPRERERYYERR